MDIREMTSRPVSPVRPRGEVDTILDAIASDVECTPTARAIALAALGLMLELRYLQVAIEQAS